MRYIRSALLYFFLLAVCKFIDIEAGVSVGLAIIINDIFELHEDLLKK